MLLEGKSAIVTGSSKGLGKAYAIGLAKEGASVVVNGMAAEEPEDRGLACPGEHPQGHIGGVAEAVVDEPG